MSSPIIKSLLDTDLYKFTMGQVALHQFPTTNVEYEFKCRNNAKWEHKHLVRLREEVKAFCKLKLRGDELTFLSELNIFKPSYLEFLRLYSPNLKHITMQIIDGVLEVFVKGPWYSTVYWEVPLLAMINEIYFEDQHASGQEGLERLKIKYLKANDAGLPFVDFGTRRRFCANWHESVVKTLKNNATSFAGTSNVYLAMKCRIKPIGTMAHEFFQVGQATGVSLVDSQKYMLQTWANEYRGKLGIALTDVIGIDAFLKDFDLYFAKLYDGVRHDSGEPSRWAGMMIQHYVDLGIDPKTKTLVFSDGLDFDKAINLYKAYKNIINVSFGIGTNLTNDFAGITPLQIVMKIVKCNGKPVAKISDSPGKGMCNDEQFVDYLKKVFND